MGWVKADNCLEGKPLVDSLTSVGSQSNGDLSQTQD